MIEIRAAGYADIVHVARNMREPDRAELYAFDPTEDPQNLAQQLDFYERFHWAALIGWEPVTIISAIEQSPTLWRVGMFSTEKWPKVALSCTRFFHQEIYPRLYHEGCNRAECRSLITHTEAHRWLESLGAQKECELHDVGPRRDSYFQYSWTRRHSDMLKKRN